jgi:hypothetical protein
MVVESVKSAPNQSSLGSTSVSLTQLGNHGSLENTDALGILIKSGFNVFMLPKRILKYNICKNKLPRTQRERRRPSSKRRKDPSRPNRPVRLPIRQSLFKILAFHIQLCLAMERGAGFLLEQCSPNFAKRNTAHLFQLEVSM